MDARGGVPLFGGGCCPRDPLPPARLRPLRGCRGDAGGEPSGRVCRSGEFWPMARPGCWGLRSNGKETLRSPSCGRWKRRRRMTCWTCSTSWSRACSSMPRMSATKLACASEFTLASDLPTCICAVLLAEACNTGLEPQIRLNTPALRRFRLSWVRQNYLLAEALTRANAAPSASHRLACSRLGRRRRGIGRWAALRDTGSDDPFGTKPARLWPGARRHLPQPHLRAVHRPGGIVVPVQLRRQERHPGSGRASHAEPPPDNIGRMGCNQAAAAACTVIALA